MTITNGKSNHAGICTNKQSGNSVFVTNFIFFVKSNIFLIISEIPEIIC